MWRRGGIDVDDVEVVSIMTFLRMTSIMCTGSGEPDGPGRPEKHFPL